MNKKYGFFLILGVAFFSFLTCPSSYATDSLPDQENYEIQLDPVDGWNRKTHFGADTSLFTSCKYEQIGILNYFPTFPIDNDTDTTSPCGYTVSNGVINGPQNRDYHYRYDYQFSSSNGRHQINATWDSSLKNNLLSPSYFASHYVSISDTFRPSGHYHMSNTSGNYYVSPVSSEDGFDYLVITIGNLGNNYFSGGFPPYLYKNATININHNPGSASHTSDEIRQMINSSAYFGWVWTKDGNKTSTLFTPSCVDKIADVSVDCSEDGIYVIPEGETFSPLTNYLNLLDDNTFFLLVGLPKFSDASYFYDYLVAFLFNHWYMFFCCAV